MLEGLKNLTGSEKAIAGGVLVICATVLVALGAMDVGSWQSYTRDIFITYASAKTVQGAISMITTRKANTEAKTETKAEAADAA